MSEATDSEQSKNEGGFTATCGSDGRWSEADIRAAIGLIWRNLPSGPSTFSQCKCGRGSGRGGGPCIVCAQEALAAALGGDRFIAWRYVMKLRSMRSMENAMIEWAHRKSQNVSDQATASK